MSEAYPLRPKGGRPFGSKNKLSEQRKMEIVAKAKVDPLAYMLKVLADPKVDDARRDDMAKAAAPYLHHRMAAIEHSGSVENVPMERLTDEQLAAEIRSLEETIAAKKVRTGAPPDPSKLN